VVIIGGGCYGSFYAGQLAAARTRGKTHFRSVVVVDHDPACAAAGKGGLAEDFVLAARDWDDFLDEFLDRPAPAAGAPDDAIVPSPLMPHLMARWLERVAGQVGGRVEPLAAEQPAGTPYEVLGQDGTRIVSHADWLCPTHGIEPHICPVIRAPRSWEMSDTIADYVRRRDRHTAPAGRRTLGPALFITRHRAFGVGMFDVAEVRAARLAVTRAAAAGADLVVATISACHGALGILRFG
jgi:hypothetical protein